MMSPEGGYIMLTDRQTGLMNGSRSWILMNSSGEETILDVDKYAIMHRVQIHARDLRILDPVLSYPSTILGREKAVVVNLEHIKAIITANEVLLRDPLDDNVGPVVEELRRRMKQVSANMDDSGDAVQPDEDDYPFEFQALEVLLEAICSFFSAHTLELETVVYTACDMLTAKNSPRNLDRVRKLKGQLASLTARVKRVRDELEQLLDDDDDMAELYLSRKIAGASPVRGSGAASNLFLASPTIGSRISSRAVRGDGDDVEELEMLLEAYFMQIDGTLNKLTTLREYIDNTRACIKIHRDNHRNQLIELEVVLMAATLCMSIYSSVAGIFGMNIPYTWNDNHGYTFKWVVIVSGVLSLVFFLLILYYTRLGHVLLPDSSCLIPVWLRMTDQKGGDMVLANPQTDVGRSVKGSRTWMLMGSSGEEFILDVDKYAVMHRVQIHARDLRILDPVLSYPSTILGREKAIVVSLEHIKAIITADEVLLRDPLGDNAVPVVEELRRRMKLVNVNEDDTGDAMQPDEAAEKEEDYPFEFQALEVALEAICSFLSARTLELETAVYPACDMLTAKITGRNLDRVSKLTSRMTSLTIRVKKVRDELGQLLDDDDDMAELYLSRKIAGASPVSGSGAVTNRFLASPTIGSKISSRAIRGDEDVEELEMLLEAYYTQIDGTLNKLTTLREYVDNTKDFIKIHRDNHRNQLLQLQIYLISATMCLAMYALVAGIFGMNIPYTWNDNHGYVFKWVVIDTGGFSLVSFVLIMSYAYFKGLVGSL